MRRIAVVFALVLSACAGSNRVALESERALQAGSDAWDAYTDGVVADCRDQQLQTEEARRECVGDVMRVDSEIVAPAVQAAVLALQAYWHGVAVGESPAELAAHLADFAAAVADLPPDYFGGLSK